jgi:hypothetical protein
MGVYIGIIACGCKFLHKAVFEERNSHVSDAAGGWS